MELLLGREEQGHATTGWGRALEIEDSDRSWDLPETDSEGGHATTGWGRVPEIEDSDRSLDWSETDSEGGDVVVARKNSSLRARIGGAQGRGGFVLSRTGCDPTAGS